jgi:aryl-alcohol dehydrogenase-like predicted oxidoreductase
MVMDYTRLNGLPDDVSVMSLGSWNTFSRVPFEDGVDLVKAALDAGINMFDVAYYWDKQHTEILFGHILRTIGVPRSEVLIAEKAWLWSYPDESLADQLKGCLVRLGMDYVDVSMVSRPIPGVDLESFVEEAAAVVTSGLARAWGMTNWEALDAQHAYDHAASKGLPTPVQVQLQYSLARREIVETPAYDQLFAATGMTLQPADSLEGGILAGGLDRDRIDPGDVKLGMLFPNRNIARDAGNIRPTIRAAYPRLQVSAARVGATPAQFALAYVLSHPYRGSALFGVSSVAQLEENLLALELSRTKADAIRAEVAQYEFGGGAHPLLFTPNAS